MTKDYTLAYGTHATAQEGRCAMEWVSHLAGEAHSDAPACVSPVLRAVCIMLNDGLADGPRQRLRPYLTRTIGTAGDGLDESRAWMSMDWIVRVFAPAWLRVAGLLESAAGLQSRAAVTDDRTLLAALPELERAQRAMRAQRVAVFAAAHNPIGARASAVVAARTGREAAWACAGAAAWAGARIGIGEPAGDRARATTRTTAGDAAAIAVHRLQADDVCGERRGRDALRGALGPTHEFLVDSLIVLLERMLPTEPIELPSEILGGLVPAGR